MLGKKTRFSLDYQQYQLRCKILTMFLLINIRYSIFYTCQINILLAIIWVKIYQQKCNTIHKMLTMFDQWYGTVCENSIYKQYLRVSFKISIVDGLNQLLRDFNDLLLSCWCLEKQEEAQGHNQVLSTSIIWKLQTNVMLLAAPEISFSPGLYWLWTVFQYLPKHPDFR